MKSIDLSSIDLNLLVAFEAIFAQRSVTAAARQVHIGQPAMSSALKRLRFLFEDDLFVRVGRDMKPTAKALAIAPGISSALKQIRLTLRSSQHFEPATARQAFVIGCSDYAGAVIAPKLLQACHERAPGIDLRLIPYEKERVSALLEQSEIAAIVGSSFQDLPQQALEQSLMKERFVGICRPGHPVAIAGSISLERFAELPHALFTLRRDDVGAIDRVLAARNLKRRIVLTTPYFLTLPAIVADTDTIAAIPSRLAQQFSDRGRVDRFELPLPMNPWTISMVWSQLSDCDPACQWLRQIIQQICGAI